MEPQVAFEKEILLQLGSRDEISTVLEAGKVNFEQAEVTGE